jgi:hypothetical protein
VNVPLRRLVFGGAIVLLQCAQSVVAQISADEMHGVWEGSVSIVDVAADTARQGFRVGDSAQLRMEIALDRVRVFVAGPGASELQMIHIARLAGSAIILGVMQTDDRIETWALTVSLQDQITMLVALSRGVQPMQASQDASVLMVGALGQLHQIDGD